MEPDYKDIVTNDASGFVVLADFVPSIIQEIRYYSTYNFIGERIIGYEEPCAIVTKEAARALQSVSGELASQGFGSASSEGAGTHCEQLRAQRNRAFAGLRRRRINGF